MAVQGPPTAPVVVTHAELDRWKRGTFTGPDDRAKFIAALVGAYYDGESPRLIASRIDRREATVAGMLREAGVPLPVPPPGAPGVRDRKRDDAILAQRAAGMTNRAIAAAHGISAGRCSGLLHRLDREAGHVSGRYVTNRERDDADRARRKAEARAEREAAAERARATVARRRAKRVGRGYRYLAMILKLPIEVTSGS